MKNSLWKHTLLQGSKNDYSRLISWGIVVLVILFTSIIRMRLLDIPLERDEGEYAYAGQLILQGIPPYELAYNMKFPGIYAMYSLILAIFGQSPRAIHLGLLLVNDATILLVFFFARRLSGWYAGIVACASYAILSLSESVLGFAAHATHFVVLPALGGFILLLRATENRRLWSFFWSGLLLGVAVMMKQPGIFFAMQGFIYILWCEARNRPTTWVQSATRVGVFSGAAAMPFGLFSLWLLLSGVFGKFWFWTFEYAREYVLEVPLYNGIQSLWERGLEVMTPAFLIWLIAGLGLVILIWDRKAQANKIFIAGFLLFSFLAVCPGLYFRSHYFVLLLPCIAVLAGIAVSAGRKFFIDMNRPNHAQVVPMLVFIAACAIALFQQRAYLFDLSPTQICCMAYGTAPFLQSVEIGRYIKAHSADTDRVGVFGSEPEIYFYSSRHSATGYIYTFALMEEQQFALRMQREMIAEIEQAPPQYLVLVNTSGSWAVRPHSERLIFNWFERYSRKNYDVVGLIDILSDGNSVSYWDEQTKDYTSRSSYYIVVFRKKGE